jgi:hypothetical protein
MIETEIEEAGRLYAAYGRDLSRQEAIAGDLEKYSKAVALTLESMLQAGVVAACTSCAGRSEGSCCFQGVEEWYDDVLLLINLLLEIEMPEQREIAGGCFFVGEKGCRLLARHAFCVNYLCPPLAGSLKAGPRSMLLAASGQELLTGWELEKKVRLWLIKRRR